MNASRPFPGYVAALLAAGAVTSVSSAARATCNTNDECGQGFTCEVVGGTACPGYACPDNGEPCPEPPPCEPQTIKECVPGACSVEADCAAGMVCQTYPMTTCPTAPAQTDPACPPGEKCEAPTPPPDMGSCTTETAGRCIPRYMLPCTTASDCGAGFNCVLDQPSCWCNGSSGGTPMSGGSGPAPEPAPSGGGTDPTIPPMNSTPPAPSGTGTSTPPDPMPSDCGCTPATTNHCEPQVVSCTANSDCLDGWVCQNVAPPSTSACSGRVLPDGGIETDCEPTPPPTVQMQCVPPYYNLGSRYYGYDSSGSAPPPALRFPRRKAEARSPAAQRATPAAKQRAFRIPEPPAPRQRQAPATPAVARSATAGRAPAHRS